MKMRKLTAMLCLILAAAVLVGCTAAKGSVKVKQGKDFTKTVDLSEMDTVLVQGTTLDASGKPVSVDEQGVLVSSVLLSAGIESSWIGDVSVQARDKSTVELTGSELNMANKAYLTQQEDGSWNLVVLGEDDGRILTDVVFLHAENI